MKYLLLFLSVFALASCTNSEASTSPQSTTIAYVDVREPSEWAAGHIEGAILVPLGEIESGNLTKIPKDTPVALYCRSGRRSAIAAGILKQAGYTNITDLGGMEQVRGVRIVR